MTDADHGYVTYTRGCRCTVCREAKRLYIRERRAAGLEIDHRRLHGVRRHDRKARRLPYNVAPVREHITRLRSLGWTWEAIARLSATNPSTVCRIARGHRCHRRVGEAILAIVPVPFLRVGRVERRCQTCQKAWVTQASTKTRYCSVRCARLAVRGRPKPGVRRYTDLDLIQYLIRASVDGVVTVNGYTRWAETHPAPTPKTIEDRFGSWKQAVAAAGLRTGATFRTYTRRWSDDDLLGFVVTALGDGVGTYAEYEQWAKRRADAPSGSLLRMRFGPWSRILALATSPSRQVAS